EGGEDGQLERLVGGRRVRRAGAVGGTGGTQCERRDGGRGECAESSGSHGRSSPSVMPESSARAEDASVTGTTDSDKQRVPSGPIAHQSEFHLDRSGNLDVTRCHHVRSTYTHLSHGWNC